MPELGESFVITGITRKDAELLATPPEVTITSANPGRSTLGTGAMIFVSVQDVGVVETPPIVTVLPLADEPNPLPLMVKGEPTGLTCPTVGETLLICGAAHADVSVISPSMKQAKTVRTLVPTVVLFVGSVFSAYKPRQDI
jgi:hypothetical protein